MLNQEKVFSISSDVPRNRQLVYARMTSDLLSTSSAYQKWRDCTTSCLLYLSGMTKAESRNLGGSSHSWLSPSTTFVTEQERRQGRKVAFYSCHPDIQGSRHSGKDIMSTLIYQVCEWYPNILRCKAEEIHAIEEHEMWQRQTDERILIKTMFQLLRIVLSEIKDVGPVFLILDRVDLCDWCDWGFERLLTAFANLTVEKLCNIKIFITATSGNDWNTDSLEETVLTRVMRHQNWTQQQLSQFTLH